MLFYILAWQRSLDFSGRSSRQEFWMFMLVHTIITIGCIVLDITLKMTTWFDAIYSLISFIPMLSAIARRLHDIHKSGYWGLIFFVPIVGPFWLIYLLAKTSIYHNDREAIA